MKNLTVNIYLNEKQNAQQSTKRSITISEIKPINNKICILLGWRLKYCRKINVRER